MTEVRGFYYPSELIGKQFVPTNLPTQNGNSRYWPDLNSQKTIQIYGAIKIIKIGLLP